MHHRHIGDVGPPCNGRGAPERKWVVSLICGVLFRPSLIGLASSDRLLVSPKATKTWLWLEEASASAAAPGGNRARLDLKACDDPHAVESSGFSKTDSTIICGILRDQALKEHI